MKSRSRLYLRILSYFLSMATIVVLVAAISGYVFLRRNELYFDRQIEANMAGVNQRLSAYFERIYNACTLFALKMDSGGYLKTYDSVNTWERYGFLEIRRALEEMQITLDDAADSIFVYSDARKVFTNAGIHDGESFFRVFNAYDRYDIEFWVETIRKGHGLEILSADRVTNGHTSKRVLVKPIVFRWYSGGRLCAVVINLHVEDILRMYRDSAVFMESRYVVYEDGEAIAGDSGLVASAPLHGKPVSGRVPGHRRYDMNVVRNDLMGWSVACITPTYAFLRTDGFFVLTTALIGAGFIALSVLFAYAYARRVYHPIRSLNDATANMVEAGTRRGSPPMNELEQILDNIRDIWKKKATYELRSRSYSAEFVRQSLTDIVDGRPVPDEEYLARVMRDELGFQRPFVQCVCFVVNEPDGSKAPGALSAETCRAIDEALGRCGALFSVRYRDNMLLCIVNPESDDSPCVCAALDALFQRLPSTVAPCVIRAGAGGARSAMRELRRSFEEAGTALLSTDGRARHAWACAPRDQDARRTASLPVDKGILLDAVRSLDVDAIRGAVAQVLRACIPRGCAFREACDVVRSIQAAGLECLRGYGFVEDGGHPRASVDCAETLLLKPWLDPEPIVACFEELLISSAPEPGIKGSLSLKVKRFIDTHSAEELSLDIIGRKMGVSAKYVSRVFKNDVHMNVSDYIAMVRVQRIKELLRGRMPLSRIAATAGLKSRTSFIRTFKKIEGVSPSEYRRMMSAGSRTNGSGVRT